MKYLPLYLIVLALFATLRGQAQQTDHVPGQVIVMIEPGMRIEKLLGTPIGTAPTPVYLHHEKTLSSSLRIYLLSFDPQQIAEQAVLLSLRKNPMIALAQFNHYLEMRSTQSTFPNDQGFPGQWALHNTGQNSGTPDADIDAPEAWDIATGGLSALGDTLVIAIVDGGVDLNHEDLIFWKNHAEIPGNGIDDDNNGYVDDYDGWNAFSSTGVLSTDVHGTEVTSVAAAGGNNTTGISGVTWNTQVMLIEASSSVESVVVEGYAYVHDMRKRYNDTNGAQGAFVVVANSSFGFNFGQAANFPLWCAMYDSLGQIGVLSVGATTNSGVDVDAQGDMPSTCASDYLITVTNTTRNDQKLPAAGFGVIHVDLGAPGTDILVANPNNNYGTDTGTSFSAPFVAGTLALMYAAACPDFMALYQDNPAAMALVVRNLLLQGVDTLSSLAGLTATSGRLNAHKSLLQMLDYCAALPDCIPPYNLSASNLTDSSALISWSATDSADSYVLQYRPADSTTWVSDTTSGLSLALSGLQACSDYEIQLTSLCGDSSSVWSQPYFFSSEGCCVPPAFIRVDSLGETFAALSWPPVYAAAGYHLQFRPLGDTLWTDLNTSNSLTEFDSLSSCTRYEIRLETLCDTGLSGFSPIFTFNTLGCGSCLDVTYCQAEANDSDDEWIESVAIGTFANASGNDGGFGGFTDSGPVLHIGVPVDVQLIPGFGGFAFNEYWRIWIDLNQDGDFDDLGERVFDPGTASNDTVNGQFLIPASANTGSTRMRVSMKFFSSFGGSGPASCESFDFGEIEDYCVTIVLDSAACNPPFEFALDSVGTDFAAFSWTPVAQADSYVVRLFEGSSLLADTLTPQSFLLLANLKPCTDYTLVAASNCPGGLSTFTDSLYFRTTGCSNCADLPYCLSAGQNVQDEWIAAFAVDTFSNVSGANAGYGDFTGSPFQLVKGRSYNATLTPGFSGQGFSEHWRIWIDLNQDGDFSDAGERVYDSVFSGPDTLQISLPIPASAIPGTTRLRIVMRYENPTGPCGSVDFGEVEDYCLEILTDTGLPTELSAGAIRLYPNPAEERVTISSTAALRSVEILDLFGRTVLKRTQLQQSTLQLDVADLAKGLYLVQVRTATGTATRRLWLR